MAEVEPFALDQVQRNEVFTVGGTALAQVAADQQGSGHGAGRPSEITALEVLDQVAATAAMAIETLGGRGIADREASTLVAPVGLHRCRRSTQ
ncbi:hypothetical protein D3C75_839840 [compost metagenome]